MPQLKAGSLVVFDDIHLYPEMWDAWQIVSTSRGVACAVNTGRYGVLLWNGSASEPMQLDISLYSGRWSVGKPRP